MMPANTISPPPGNAAPRTASDMVRLVLRHCQRVIAIGLGFCIPLSTTLSTTLIAIYFVLWMVLGDWRTLASIVRTNRVVAAGIAMFALLMLGGLASSATPREVGQTLLKYRELLYLPLLLSIFADSAIRQWAVGSFLAGVGVMLGLSYVEFFSGIDIGLLSSTDQVIFKDRIIHCLLVAFFAYVLSHQAVAQSRGRWWRVIVIAAALFNMFVLVQGRTGQMIVTLLFILFVFQLKSWKGCVAGAMCALLFWGAAYKLAKPVQQRLNDSFAQLDDQFGAAKKRSPDARLEYYELSLQIVRENLWAGVGTGGFRKAYQRVAEARSAPATADPHNEYLLLAVQLGLIGPIAFLAMLGSQWWYSRQLPAVERHLAQGAVVTIGAGCLVNSLMYSFTGGLFWGYFSALTFAALTPDVLSRVSDVPLSADSKLRAAA